MHFVQSAKKIDGMYKSSPELMLTKLRCRPPHFKEMEELKKCLQSQESKKEILAPGEGTMGQWRHQGVCSQEGEAVENWLDKRYKRSGWGKGAFRAAFILNDKCILKVPHDKAGAEHQLEEATTWNRAKTSPLMRKWLLPVTSYGSFGEWLIMPRIGTENDWKGGKSDWYREVVKAKKEIEKEGLYCDDLHQGNWGWKKDGTLVSIDYGFGCKLENERPKRDWYTTIADIDESDSKKLKTGSILGIPITITTSTSNFCNYPCAMVGRCTRKVGHKGSHDCTTYRDTGLCNWRCKHGSRCIGNTGHKGLHWSEDGCNWPSRMSSGVR